ncbi:hypothetical protein V8F44DRAFT_475249, partial [Aspergillus fumigatus]
ELQPLYAPELRITRAALGGTVPYMPPVLDPISKGTRAGLILAGLHGFANEY